MNCRSDDFEFALLILNHISAAVCDISGFGYDILCQKRKYVLWIAFTSMRFEDLFHGRKQYIRNNWAFCDQMCISYSQGKGDISRLILTPSFRSSLKMFVMWKMLRCWSLEISSKWLCY
jgi:hypothetical protein